MSRPSRNAYDAWSGYGHLDSELDSDRVYGESLLLAAAVAFFAATGFGRMHEQGEPASIVVFSLAAAGLACAVAYRRGIFLLPGESAIRAAGAGAVPMLVVCAFGILPGLARGAFDWRLAALFGAIAFCGTALGGVGPLRVLSDLVLAAAAVAAFVWVSGVEETWSIVIVAAVAVAVCLVLLFATSPRTMQPAGVLAALAAVVLVQTAFAGTTFPERASSPSVSWQLAWTVVLATICVRSAFCDDNRGPWHNGIVVAAIHLSGVMYSEIAYEGLLGAHIAAAGVEALLLAIAAFRYDRAFARCISNVPATYTRARCVVPRLDASLDYALESDAVEPARAAPKGERR